MATYFLSRGPEVLVFFVLFLLTLALFCELLKILREDCHDSQCSYLTEPFVEPSTQPSSPALPRPTQEGGPTAGLHWMSGPSPYTAWKAKNRSSICLPTVPTADQAPDSNTCRMRTGIRDPLPPSGGAGLTREGMHSSLREEGPGGRNPGPGAFRVGSL